MSSTTNFPNEKPKESLIENSAIFSSTIIFKNYNYIHEYYGIPSKSSDAVDFILHG